MGLVKEHEDFIRRRADWFANAHPQLNRNHVLNEAVKISMQAEKAYKGDLASFKTYLTHRLKELHRLQELEDKGRSSEIFRTAEDLAGEEADERGEDVTHNFGPGNSGARS